MQEKSGWHCSCGAYNRYDEDRCNECGQKEDENINYQVEIKKGGEENGARHLRYD